MVLLRNSPPTCSTTTRLTVAMGRLKARTRGILDPTVQCLLSDPHACAFGRRGVAGLDFVSGCDHLAAPRERLRVAELRGRISEDRSGDRCGAHLLAFVRSV